MDLPVAANVVDELDKPMDPEHTRNDQDGDKGAIFLNPVGEKEGNEEWPLRSLGRQDAIPKAGETEAESVFERMCLPLHSIPHLLVELWL